MYCWVNEAILSSFQLCSIRRSTTLVLLVWMSKFLMCVARKSEKQIEAKDSEESITRLSTYNIWQKWQALPNGERKQEQQHQMRHLDHPAEMTEAALLKKRPCWSAWLRDFQTEDPGHSVCHSPPALTLVLCCGGHRKSLCQAYPSVTWTHSTSYTMDCRKGWTMGSHILHPQSICLLHRAPHLKSCFPFPVLSRAGHCSHFLSIYCLYLAGAFRMRTGH